MSLVIGLLIFTVISTVLLSTRMLKPLKKTSLENPIPGSISEIVTYLESSERFSKPKPGTEKKIFFPNNQIDKAKLSFVYLHGFSASRQETSPVFETLARQWKAPIFMTRFRGHGMGPQDLGDARQEQWIQDALEAYQIGLTLGDEVVLACMSTGCALGLYLGYFFPNKIRAIIMLSPNFAPADSRAFLAAGPLGPLVTKMVVGDYHEFVPTNSEQAYYWTNRYGSAVLSEMISLVTSIKNLDLEKIQIPVLTLYTPFDQVISAPEVERNVARLKSPHNKLVPLIETQEHVIAGNILNPKMNDRVQKEINDFLVAILERK
ncbi:MAG: hypothetical protein RJB66_2028 [Pseudomonadota bacterium]